jgi:hypothetical protein
MSASSEGQRIYGEDIWLVGKGGEISKDVFVSPPIVRTIQYIKAVAGACCLILTVAFLCGWQIEAFPILDS